ncbi:MAG: hypothetical protein R3A47_11580 [Polyangiales bacterium]
MLEDEKGDVKQSDKWRLDAALAEVRARKAQTTYLKQTTTSALAVLTGVKSRSGCRPSEPVPVTLGKRATLVENATSSRAEVAMLSAARNVRPNQRQNQQGRYYPDLARSWRRSHRNSWRHRHPQSVHFRSRKQSLAPAALVAKWQLDFGTNVGRVKRAKADLPNSTPSKEALAGIELEVISAYEAFVEASERVDAWALGEKQTARVVHFGSTGDGSRDH